MQICSAIDVDCSELISECSRQCRRCFDEIRNTLTNMPGVKRAYIEERAGERRLVVEHDPAVVIAGQLVTAVERLPTFREGSFLARLIAR